MMIMTSLILLKWRCSYYVAVYFIFYLELQWMQHLFRSVNNVMQLCLKYCRKIHVYPCFHYSCYWHLKSGTKVWSAFDQLFENRCKLWSQLWSLKFTQSYNLIIKVTYWYVDWVSGFEIRDATLSKKRKQKEEWNSRCYWLLNITELQARHIKN